MEISKEFAHTISGVTGRMFGRMAWDEARFSSQRWMSEGRPFGGEGWGPNARLHAELRFDDQCKNGHNTFAMTATISGAARWDENGSIGCHHEAIARLFPELAHLIRWHLVDSEKGPMHGVANALYHASDRDCWGRRAGEPSAFAWGVRFAGVPALHPLKGGSFRQWLEGLAEYDRAGLEAALIPVAVAGDKAASGYQFAPKWQFAGQPPLKWHECPFDTEGQAERFAASWLDYSPELVRVPVAFSEGKARDLDAARRVAVWPEATDAELMQEPDILRPVLEARIAPLIAAFRQDVEAAGFLWAPSDYQPA